MTVGASRRIKEILKYKKMTQEEFSHIAFPDRSTASAQFRNLLAYDALRFNEVERWLDLLGVDIVFIDRKTKKQFRP